MALGRLRRSRSASAPSGRGGGRRRVGAAVGLAVGGAVGSASARASAAREDRERPLRPVDVAVGGGLRGRLDRVRARARAPGTGSITMRRVVARDRRRPSPVTVPLASTQLQRAPVGVHRLAVDAADDRRRSLDLGVPVGRGVLELGVGIHDAGEREERETDGEQEGSRAPDGKVTHHDGESTRNAPPTRSSVPAEVTVQIEYPGEPLRRIAPAPATSAPRRSPVVGESALVGFAIARSSVAICLLLVGAEPWLRVLVFLPLAGGIVSLEQARRHFCAGFALAGIRNFGHLGRAGARRRCDGRTRPTDRAAPCSCSATRPPSPP